MATVKQRARNSLYGLAIGDAISWPALYHRTYTLPFWTRRLRREIDVFQEDYNIIRFPMPFTLNRPTENLQFAPTDDTEWATFTALSLIQTEGNLTKDDVYRAWSELAIQEESVRGPISVVGALRNIRNGMKPPITGHDNAHYFDDAACARAIAVGAAFPGRVEDVGDIVAIDAEVTNAEDGVWAAQSLGAAVAAACGGGGLSETVSVALSSLPKHSWIERTTRRALHIAEKHVGLGAMPHLDAIVNKEYSYGGAAPEVLALSLAVTVLADGDFERGLTYSLAIPKLADSLPAIVGALCGALTDGELSCFSEWRPVIAELKGICLPKLAGTNYFDVVEQLVHLGDVEGGYDE